MFISTTVVPIARGGRLPEVEALQVRHSDPPSMLLTPSSFLVELCPVCLVCIVWLLARLTTSDSCVDFLATHTVGVVRCQSQMQRD